MAITLLGKVMGLYRDHLLAVHYGMGMEANAFYTASRIPRVFFDAVFASAIAACFIPVQRVSGTEGKEGGLPLRGLLYYHHRPAHRRSYLGGDGLSPAVGGPLCRL